MNYESTVDGIYVLLLLLLVGLTVMLLAVETKISLLVRFHPCIVSVISVVVLLVKFVGEFSLLLVCSVDKAVCRPQVAVGIGSVVSVLS